uniref:Fatty acid binding protein 10b, liver basic n=1 Tax=Lates calcarifer TaxID=8187 RepID=A0A4W6DSP5_LATCA
MTTRTTNILRQATQPEGMDFNGTWQVYSEENLEEFLKAIGAPEIAAKMCKLLIVIEQNGKDFTHIIKTAVCTTVHSFTIGKETETTAVDGKKMKCTFREEDGKLIAETDKFTSVREIQGDNMVEVSGFSSINRDLDGEFL